jgi:hypothetical protein
MMIIATVTMLGNTIVSLYMLLKEALGSNPAILIVKNAILGIYLWVTVAQIIYGCGNDPRNHPEFYKLVMCIYGFVFLMMYAMALKALCFPEHGPPNSLLIAGVASSAGSIFFTAAIHGEFVTIIRVMPHYLVSYSSLLQIIPHCLCPS